MWPNHPAHRGARSGDGFDASLNRINGHSFGREVEKGIFDVLKKVRKWFFAFFRVFRWILKRMGRPNMGCEYELSTFVRLAATALQSWEKNEKRSKKKKKMKKV